MATKKTLDLTTLSDKELQAELLRRQQEREKPMREAMNRLGSITTELDDLLAEATKLCKEHKIVFQYTIDDFQVTVDRNGTRTTESTFEESSWQSSSYQC